jgi:lipoprotein-anchoring transpeptidase ErfK/SrfK
MQSVAGPDRTGMLKALLTVAIVTAFWTGVVGLVSDRETGAVAVTRVQEDTVQVPEAPAPPPPVVEPPPNTLASFVHPGESLVADAAVSRIPVHDAPDGKVVQTLSNPTHENALLVMSVKERSGGWLKVQFPMRPNESTGWIKESTVDLRSVPNHIVVEVSNRKLSAFSGSTLLMETPVGVGKARTPTPVGTFYVDIAVKNPGGAYGAYMLSVAGFSNVLKSFGNGIGQVAIHGTNNPGSVGQFSSNGCMRLNNSAVLQLATLAPPGTPVFILP